MSDIENDFIIIFKDDLEDNNNYSKKDENNLESTVSSGNIESSILKDNLDLTISKDNNKKQDPFLAFQLNIFNPSTLFPENQWNYSTTIKYLNQWRNYRFSKLSYKNNILHNFKNIQNRRMLNYWRKYAKNFRKFKEIKEVNKLLIYNDTSNNVQLNEIIIENDNIVSNICEKEEAVLIKKNNCIDDCIELIIDNFLFPIKNFFNEINNYCSPKISELYNNFINSFKNTN